jgi:competence protein ComEC
VISFLGYLKLLIGLVLPTAASILNVIIKPLSNLLIWLVKCMAQIDFSQVLIGHIAIWPIVFYYCTILFIAFIHFKRPFLKKLISVTMILAVIIFLGITQWQRTQRDNLIMTCLDVGHGQAILAQLPDGANILFDAGSLHKSDVGRRIVATFLDYSGISKIDSIIISHSDVDHINGIPEIVAHCDVNDVYANDTFFAEMRTDPNGTATFLEECLRKRGLEIQHLGKELPLSSKVKIKILWPTGQMLQDEKLSENDTSAVSLFEFAGKKNTFMFRY